jgi:hypothetical protein
MKIEIPLMTDKILEAYRCLMSLPFSRQGRVKPGRDHTGIDSLATAIYIHPLIDHILRQKILHPSQCSDYHPTPWTTNLSVVYILFFTAIGTIDNLRRNFLDKLRWA